MTGPRIPRFGTKPALLMLLRLHLLGTFSSLYRGYDQDSRWQFCTPCHLQPKHIESSYTSSYSHQLCPSCQATLPLCTPSETCPVYEWHTVVYQGFLSILPVTEDRGRSATDSIRSLSWLWNCITMFPIYRCLTRGNQIRYIVLDWWGITPMIRGMTENRPAPWNRE